MLLIIAIFLTPPFAQRTRKGWGTQVFHIPIRVTRRVVLVFALGVLHAAGDDDLPRDFFVDGRDIVLPVAIVEDADHGFLLALHDADDLAFGAAVVADAAEFDQHLVAMHGVADLGRRD